MTRPVALALVPLLFLSAASAVRAAAELPFAVVVLQGLDKITARTRHFRVRVGETSRFGTLEITAEACFETPPIEPPESAAFLRIDAVDPGRPRQRAFSGWMFASSPSLSALEHPVYDVWVVDCEEPLTAAATSSPSPPPANSE
ncbi:hypothetical protein HRbin40_00719 [bacterium HR40]|nr:hypothetical protein HRbin40_00719 [bacterium HR40]